MFSYLLGFTVSVSQYLISRPTFTSDVHLTIFRNPISTSFISPPYYISSFPQSLFNFPLLNFTSHSRPFLPIPFFTVLFNHSFLSVFRLFSYAIFSSFNILRYSFLSLIGLSFNISFQPPSHRLAVASFLYMSIFPTFSYFTSIYFFILSQSSRSTRMAATQRASMT